MAKKKKDDLEKDDELLEDEESSEEEDSEKDEENPEDDQDESSDESTEEDSSDDNITGDTVSVDMYKGLQRTLARREKEVEAQKLAAEKARKELDDFQASLNADEAVRATLVNNLQDALKRVSALENENKQSKVEAMQSDIILKDFPSLARMKDYIPSAETEEEYRKNCEQFADVLGDNVTKALDEELTNTTLPVEDEEPTISQAHLDKLYAKAMAHALPGQEKEFNKAMDDYTDALAKA